MSLKPGRVDVVKSKNSRNFNRDVYVFFWKRIGLFKNSSFDIVNHTGLMALATHRKYFGIEFVQFYILKRP